MADRSGYEHEVVAEMATALAALRRQDRPSFETAAARVATRPGVGGWRREAERQVARALTAGVARSWRLGWQPADLVRVVRRREPQGLSLLRHALAAELQSYPSRTLDPRWAAQLAEEDIAVRWRANEPFIRVWTQQEPGGWALGVRTALELVELLATLPELGLLGPLPGTAAPAAAGPVPNERILARVRALLAKAESSTFPAEAETFTAGAQALMAKHSIDEALLAATAPQRAGFPGGVRIGIDNPYELPKAALLDVVAEANRCRSVWSRHVGFCTVVGFPTDVAAVELLFTSLLVQATASMTQAGARTDRYGRSRTRSFRSSFLSAYASRIGERLREATTAETARAGEEHSGRNLLPVLAARRRDVDDAVDAFFPQLKQARSGSVTNVEGWVTGRAAADLASLGSAPALDR
ncbi:MAG TPA: DUF2786 domain-containing protein [Dermatophilaceae bacterium]|nr:DUF2786 domain-containing protein [Dermatophilaceae bacterium]